MKKLLFSLFAAVMAVSFIACANSSDSSSSDSKEPEKKPGEETVDEPGEETVVTKTYTVTYVDGLESETVTVPVDTKQYNEGDTVTVLFDGIGSRDMYIFMGWTDGENTYTKDGPKTFKMPAKNVTLTATWKKKGGMVIAGHRVIYNDGVLDETIDVPEDNNFYMNGETVNVIFNGIGSRENYDFDGWSDGTNIYKEDGTTSFTMLRNNVTLTAQWKAKGNTQEEDYNFAGSRWTASEGKGKNTTNYDLVFSKKDNTVKSNKGFGASGTYTSQGKTAVVTLVTDSGNIEFNFIVDDSEEPHTANDDSKNLVWTRGEDNYDIEGTVWKVSADTNTFTVTFDEDDNTLTYKHDDTEESGSYTIAGTFIYITIEGKDQVTYKINTTVTPHTMQLNNGTGLIYVKQE